MSQPDSSIEVSRSPAGVAGRGVLMGLAEVVPGVSGGTIAFITGIYPQLVRSLSRFGPGSVVMLARPREFFVHHDLGFLLALAAGMAAGVAAFAQLMSYLLAHHQPLVWAFFSGVIAMSVLVIGRPRAPRALLAWAPVGALVGILLLWLPSTSGEATLFNVFWGGALAVCAWLLPAVSGSYVLLALGLYAQIIDALATLQWDVLLVLAAGCGTGLLLFARLLAWLLRGFSEQLLSFLTGFMLGSMPRLWPWQDAAGSEAVQRLLAPSAYAELTGASPDVLLALVALCAGAASLWLLSRLTDA